MNIFYLDENIYKSVEYHADKHVCSQLKETAQMLCTINNLLGLPSPYRTTHASHPCTVWAMSSRSNYKYLRLLGELLYKEYKFRYGDKVHKSGEVILNLETPDLEDKGFTSPALAMPDECKIGNDPVSSYRKYYEDCKQHLAQWDKGRSVPDWYEYREYNVLELRKK
jgi:hypothetical protein